MQSLDWKVAAEGWGGRSGGEEIAKPQAAANSRAAAPVAFVAAAVSSGDGDGFGFFGGRLSFRAVCRVSCVGFVLRAIGFWRRGLRRRWRWVPGHVPVSHAIPGTRDCVA